jgi:hypothetical protein
MAASFNAFQNKELLKQVIGACGRRELWSFVKVFLTQVLEPLESARRWGMVCDCCNELRQQLKKARCPRASRRLHRARKFVENLCQQLLRNAAGLTLAFCDGVHWILLSVSAALRRVAAELKEKFRWLWRVPWLVAEADDPEIAAVCVAQLSVADAGSLDTLALEYREVFLEALQVHGIPEPP